MPTGRALQPTSTSQATTGQTPGATPTPDPGVIHGGPWLFEGTPSPLHLAAVYGEPAELDELLAQGEDIDARVAIWNSELGVRISTATPLHLAALFNPDLAVATLLLEW